MTAKPTYEELEQRVKELENEAFERKQAEEVSLESGIKAQQYLDIAGVAFVVMNTESEITLINKKGLEILGYEHEELLGKNWFKTCLAERTTDEVLDVYCQLINPGVR